MATLRQGTLYIVATPIGNLKDLTFRALKILQEVSLIACEDTRRTLKLLNHFRIKKHLISYFHPKEKQKIPTIIKALKEGKDVALVSDAGTPGVSDPGFPLIQEALQEGIKIVPIPGASAITAALACSGLSTHRFIFLGFPPAKKEASRKWLHSLKEEPSTLIIFLPTRRLPDFLIMVEETLGKRKTVVSREMTKVHEEFIRGTPKEILENFSPGQLKGEITLIIEGKQRRKS
ncbi:MAG: 16S rRNA (cytidine(1402)-2'-O)-methyltransferase [Acidobacteriota bacterium]